ncbi:unnamed protein product [Durusdinium trenchii]|uniref:Phosphatase PAP2 family protein n=2 Tax=Durusdinium trenchii TaxID=1381693 RepID=A0ABP0NEA3_9DINO
MVRGLLRRSRLWPAVLAVVTATLPLLRKVPLGSFVLAPVSAAQAGHANSRHSMLDGYTGRITGSMALGFRSKGAVWGQVAAGKGLGRSRGHRVPFLWRGQSGSSGAGRPGFQHGRAAGAQDSAGESIGEVPGDRSQLVQAWGVVGVVAYLSYGVAKVVPIVLDGLGAITEPWQWGLLAVTLLFFAYVEGYRGFQLGFSPRVVSRAWVVSEEAEYAPVWHKVLAPAFCIGYFHGSKKRVITSWAVTTVIFLVVIGVRQLDNPYRAIIDAGVIVGLMWGILSIIVIYLASLQSQKPPEFDPALPDETPYTRLN